MAANNHTPISLFWFAFVPAVVLGIGYVLWQSDGFVGEQVRGVFGPLVYFVLRQFNALF